MTARVLSYDAPPRTIRGGRGHAIDRDALAELYRLHGAAVYRRARALLRDDEEARDVMQETFARLLANHRRLRGEAPVLHWLYRVSTNLSLKRLRKQKTHPIAPDPTALERIASGSEAQQVDRLAVVALLAQLRPAARAIAVYYYLDRMTMAEIGEVTGQSRKTVGRHLARIQTRARALLS